MKIESHDNLTQAEMFNIIEHYRQRIALLDARQMRDETVIEGDIEVTLYDRDFDEDGDKVLEGYISLTSPMTNLKELRYSVCCEVVEHFMDYIRDYEYPEEFTLGDFQEEYRQDIQNDM